MTEKLFTGTLNHNQNKKKTNSTDRDTILKACDTVVACKPNLNVNFTEMMQFITTSRIDQVFINVITCVSVSYTLRSVDYSSFFSGFHCQFIQRL